MTSYMIRFGFYYVIGFVSEEIHPNTQLQNQFIHRNPFSVGTQIGAVISEEEVQLRENLSI